MTYTIVTTSIYGDIRVTTKSTFCPLPWNRIATTAMGTIRLCCHVAPTVGLARKSDGSLCNLPMNLEEAWNTELFKDVRQTMKRGDWHPACESCRIREKNGEHSPRLQMVSLSSQDSIDDLSIQVPITNVRALDLRLGNKCNLKCRMCSPESSSAWIDDWQKIVGPYEPESQRHLKDFWYEDEKTWTEFINTIPHVTEVLMTGGEPLLIQGNKKFLKACVDSGRAKYISLDYNTNGTVVDQELFDLWKQFSMVTLKISIDGVGPLNDYIRHPSRWERILANLKIYKQAAQDSNINLSVYCTVQIYNIFQVPNIIEFFSAMEIKLQFNTVIDPKCLSLAALPASLAKQASELIANIPFFPEQDSFLKTLSLSNQKLWEDFCEFTRRLDHIRNESIVNYIPELRGEFLRTRSQPRHDRWWNQYKSEW